MTNTKGTAMSLRTKMNQVQAQLSKHKWLKSVLPVTLLLLVAAGAAAYFPRSAKGGALATVTAVDPGPRPLPANAGGFLPSLSANEQQIEPSITTEFNRVHDVIVTSPTDGGLGPRFNSNSCASCHAYPAVGGSSPPSNPLFSVYHLNGATNTMPFFITSTGPILEVRFINVPGTSTPDGNVHQNFTVVGRSDAHGCSITQPDFTTASSTGNLALRQVPPTYGDGLIEVVRNIDIVNNKTFPNEIDQTPGCVFNGVPETVTNFTPGILTEMFPGDAERTEYFIQWMAPPTAAPSTPSINNGRTQFTNAGCVMCHTTSYKTPATSRPALGNLTIKLYSDLLVHHMGPGLADGLAQGGAGPDEFRTAPLWGIGQRLFFMHDGRTNNIVTAIEDHFSLGNSTYPASEANQSVTNFNNLNSTNQQDLVNFLRSL